MIVIIKLWYEKGNIESCFPTTWGEAALDGKSNEMKNEGMRGQIGLDTTWVFVGLASWELG